jgi:hypothetical protein
MAALEGRTEGWIADLHPPPPVRPPVHHYGFLIAQIFFGLWLVPDVGEIINGFVTIPSAIAEISMVLYLLVKGVRSSPQIEVIDRSQMPTVSLPATA